MSKGILIVLEGIDGSGKSSQYRRLCEKLDAAGIAYSHINFPRYDKESSALIREYLNGDFGTHPQDVNAYAASTFYAVDRFASYKEEWQKIYENGGVIIADRYVTSNAVHQGCKVEENQLEEYFAWLEDFEYKKLGLPVPDKVIYLDIDIATSVARMRKRESETNTHADIHEKDLDYLARCLKTARKAAAFFNWKKIDFMHDGFEREFEEKNCEIYDLVVNTIHSVNNNE